MGVRTVLGLTVNSKAEIDLSISLFCTVGQQRSLEPRLSKGVKMRDSGTARKKKKRSVEASKGRQK